MTHDHASAAVPGPDHDPLARILLVEEGRIDPKPLALLLTHAGFDVRTAVPGPAAREEAAAWRPQIILLGLRLDSNDGLRTIDEFRLPDTKIIVISPADQERLKVAALDFGADDYITAPVGFHELHARIRAALRTHSDPIPRNVIVCGPIRIDMSTRQVTLDGRKVRLTRKEFGLISALAEHAGTIVPYGRLMDEICGPRLPRKHHYVHVYINNIRRKLEPDATRPRFLRTAPNVGYILTPGEE